MLTFSSFDKKNSCKQLYMWSSLIAEFQVRYKIGNTQRCIKILNIKLLIGMS
jgi:hypothetical protein